jgi:ribosomal protein L34
VENPSTSVVLPDMRDGERRLRATWHPATRTVVISNWSDRVCTASTRLALADAAKLVGLIVGALQDAAAEAPLVPQTEQDHQARVAGFIARMGSALRAGRAEVVKLRERERERHKPPGMPFTPNGPVN